MRRHIFGIYTLLTILLLLFLSSCNNKGGNIKYIYGTIAYDNSISYSQAQSLKSFLESSWKDQDNIIRDIRLEKFYDVFQVKFQIKETVNINDPGLIADATDLSRALSTNVFNNQDVEIHLCDEIWFTKQVVSLNGIKDMDNIGVSLDEIEK